VIVTLRIKTRTLPQHEFIGLNAIVTDATSNNYIGLAGKVVDETKNMIILEDNKGREIKIPKKGTTFKFTLSGGEEVELYGSLFMYRPEDRIKRSMWYWKQVKKLQRK
jgi:ribonuclease P protein subunit POP4